MPGDWRTILFTRDGEARPGVDQRRKEARQINQNTCLQIRMKDIFEKTRLAKIKTSTLIPIEP
jgi:hypothetical protein